VRSQVRIINSTQLQNANPNLVDPVGYRKSGLSLNHIIGCPLDCNYCVRHLYGNFDQRTPQALMSDEEAFQRFINHRYFQPHITPIELFNGRPTRCSPRSKIIPTIYCVCLMRLAKLANHTAKRLQAETGGVVDICDPFKGDWVLRNTDVSEVWGVGRRMKMHLDALGVKTAMDLAKADPRMLRTKFSVVIEKTARELAGTPCLELVEPAPPKQEICCSRMFGKRLTELAPIKEAVATYMMRASEKLRAQGSVCKKIRVSFRTGMFNTEEAKFANGVVVDLPYPTDDVRLLTKAALDALERVYRPGFKYSKVEVMLLNPASTRMICLRSHSRQRRPM